MKQLLRSYSFFKNVATAIQVGEARGVILLTLEEEDIPIYEYTPLIKLNKRLLVMDTQRKVRFKEP